MACVTLHRQSAVLQLLAAMSPGLLLHNRGSCCPALPDLSTLLSSNAI
jgi:hypothetical protein